MMKILYTIVFLVISSSLMAQNVVDSNGKKQGTWSKKYPNGNVRYTGEFENDKEVGEFKFFDKNGKLVSTRTYSTPGGKAWCKMYNFKEHLHAQGFMMGKKKEGEWIFYAKNGLDTVSIEMYSNGLLDGVKRTYFDNGVLASEISFVKGEIQGKFIEYFDTGAKEQEGNYTDGQLNGELKIWYKTGQLKRKAFYEMGNQKGKWIYYDPDGRVREVVDYNKQ